MASGDTRLPEDLGALKNGYKARHSQIRARPSIQHKAGKTTTTAGTAGGRVRGKPGGRSPDEKQTTAGGARNHASPGRARQARKKKSPKRKPRAQNETEDKSMKRIVNVTIKMLDRMSDPETMGYGIAEEFEAIHNMMVEAAENDGISNHYTRAAAAFARGYQSNTGDYEYTHITDCFDLHSISISAEGLAIMAAYICDIYADYIKFVCKELGIDVPKTIAALWSTKDAETDGENTNNTETEENAMKKTYYVHYYNDFGNTYNLYYAETAADLAALPEGAERITRKQALALASEETWRRKADQAFSGYASEAIYPAADATKCDEFGACCVDWRNDRRYWWNGRIVERVKK